jgi:hypothetical protein
MKGNFVDFHRRRGALGIDIKQGFAEIVVVSSLRPIISDRKFDFCELVRHDPGVEGLGGGGNRASSEHTPMTASGLVNDICLPSDAYPRLDRAQGPAPGPTQAHYIPGPGLSPGKIRGSSAISPKAVPFARPALGGGGARENPGPNQPSGHCTGPCLIFRRRRIEVLEFEN